MSESSTRYSTLRRLAALYGPQIDAAYARRIRRQCSREDFAEGYVSGLLDMLPVGQSHNTQEGADVLAEGRADG